MTEKTPTENPADRRSEIRENLEKIKSLELKLPDLSIQTAPASHSHETSRFQTDAESIPAPTPF
jgi:hypothetical protein